MAGHTANGGRSSDSGLADSFRSAAFQLPVFRQAGAAGNSPLRLQGRRTSHFQWNSSTFAALKKSFTAFGTISMIPRVLQN
jgi:hypothetical protein